MDFVIADAYVDGDIVVLYLCLRTRFVLIQLPLLLIRIRRPSDFYYLLFFLASFQVVHACKESEICVHNPSPFFSFLFLFLLLAFWFWAAKGCVATRKVPCVEKVY
ncbi:hypothetical protein EJ02DRAFT_114354 [Clathrospora elynae]|uniref:Uncharacterized protein n=1 Tax=Clathrospora elynae TaxID=706981 RepID=A0A6A5SW68_9PLEO|nr:hypothetical protein EJ02DRAFT_114354 [Clathrospora elynae]